MEDLPTCFLSKPVAMWTIFDTDRGNEEESAVISRDSKVYRDEFRAHPVRLWDFQTAGRRCLKGRKDAIFGTIAEAGVVVPSNANDYIGGITPSGAGVLLDSGCYEARLYRNLVFGKTTAGCFCWTVGH